MLLKELRNRLKLHGFKVTTERFTWPESRRHGTIIRISDNKEMPTIFFSEERQQEWIEAINIASSINCVMDEDEKILGLALTKCLRPYSWYF